MDTNANSVRFLEGKPELPVRLWEHVRFIRDDQAQLVGFLIWEAEPIWS